MTDARASFISAAALLAARDLRLALRRAGDSLLPLAFFLVITTLFPLSLDPSLSLLRDIAPAALWVGALLSSLLALDLLFRDDGQDGTLEQLALCGQPFAGLLLAKTVVHWCLTGFPLVLVAPLAATALGAAKGCRIMRVHDVAAHRQQRFPAGAAGAAAGRAGAHLRRTRQCACHCGGIAGSAAVSARGFRGAGRDAGALGARGRGSNWIGVDRSNCGLGMVP